MRDKVQTPNMRHMKIGGSLSILKQKENDSTLNLKYSMQDN